jgi:hypothetical protein
MRFAVLLFSCLTLGGCMDEEGEPAEPSCNDRYTGRALDGDWSLSGSGVRRDCHSRRLEGDLTLRTAMAIAVEATAQATSGAPTGPEPSSEADAFVSRIERADYLLTLDDSASDEVQDKLTLQGGVNGSCVSFDLTEELPGGDQIEYHFDGFIVGSSSARGEFWGDGPEECEVEGQFELTVR